MKSFEHKIRLVLLRVLLLFALSISSHDYAYTQCCSGGVPMSGNLGLPIADANTLQMSLNVDLNTLGTYKSGTDILSSNEFRRQTLSTLLEIGYSMSEKISFDVLIPYIQQKREILRSMDIQKTNGIGDFSFLLKYKLLNGLNIGLGVKAPVGDSDLSSEMIQLPLDLQPGSGAWDILYFGQYNKSLPAIRPTSSLSFTLIYRETGIKNNFRQVQAYEVGNEFQLAASFSDQFLLGPYIFDPSLTFRYRMAGRDTIDEYPFPNSGGEWIFINPGISFRATPDFSIQANIEFPLYSQLDGTQLTPSSRINIGLYYQMHLKKNDIEIFPIP